MRAIIFATLIFTAVFTAPIVHATGNAGCSGGVTDSTVPAETDDSLYRVRVGDVGCGEIAGRFYIERNILKASSELNIAGDYDPDGDGWALVAHSAVDNDGKELLYFWTDPETNVPYLVLGVIDTDIQILLTPVSLSIVVENGNRLLKPVQSGYGTTVIIVPVSDDEPVQSDADDTGIILLEDEINVGQPQAQSVVVTPQPADARAIQQADDVPGVGESVQILPGGDVDGAVTVKATGDFNSPGESTVDVPGKITNKSIISGSIVTVVLLGLAWLIRSAGLFVK